MHQDTYGFEILTMTQIFGMPIPYSFQGTHPGELIDRNIEGESIFNFFVFFAFLTIALYIHTFATWSVERQTFLWSFHLNKTGTLVF